MRRIAITGSVLAAGLSLAGIVGLAGFAGAANSESAASFAGAQPAASHPEVPGPQPADVAHGALRAPGGAYYDVYSRDVNGAHAGAEDALNAIGLYLRLDPSQLQGEDAYAEDVYGDYDCSLVSKQGTQHLGVSCDYEGGLPVVAFMQAS
ncbi:hypothetical protein ACL03H_22580 [Saccharopolyspora sp. MS10]|uniref:hypothetical protein n=1 Tax=Saccharopolyspora sp. MS10 TaxID=3385973 RepID=UPI0039A00E6D